MSKSLAVRSAAMRPKRLRKLRLWLRYYPCTPRGFTGYHQPCDPLSGEVMYEVPVQEEVSSILKARHLCRETTVTQQQPRKPLPKLRRRPR